MVVVDLIFDSVGDFAMEVAIVILVWILNFAISWWNARVVGVTWSETKEMGGWPRFMSWMASIMSASGFTWCYLIALLFGAYYAQFAILKPGPEGVVPILTLVHIKGGFALGYLIIIPGILFSGLMIWVDSVVKAWRRRDLASMGTAAWNTFAQAHNTYNAMRGMPEVFESIGKLFSGKGSNKGAPILLVIVLVVLALLGGILTTWSLVNHYAGSRELPEPARRW